MIMKKNKSQKQEVNDVFTTLKQVLNNELELSYSDKLEILSACYEDNSRRFKELENLPAVEQKLGVLYVCLLNKKLVREMKYCIDRIVENLTKEDVDKFDFSVLLGELAVIETNSNVFINEILDEYIDTFGIGEKN